MKNQNKLDKESQSWISNFEESKPINFFDLILMSIGVVVFSLIFGLTIGNFFFPA